MRNEYFTLDAIFLIKYSFFNKVRGRFTKKIREMQSYSDDSRKNIIGHFSWIALHFYKITHFYSITKMSDYRYLQTVISLLPDGIAGKSELKGRDTAWRLYHMDFLNKNWKIEEKFWTYNSMSFFGSSTDLTSVLSESAMFVYFFRAERELDSNCA